MTFSFKAAERARRHDPGATLSRRDDGLLPFVRDASAGNGLLLDTCVYIDQVQGRAPNIVVDLLSVRVANHSTIAIQELLHIVGVLDPNDPRSQSAVAVIGRLVDGMPSHRIFTPDAEVLGIAAVYAGMLCRHQGYARDDRMNALHDCVLFLQAMKLGFSVLTRNVKDFDLLLQMRPDGRALFYRVESSSSRREPPVM